MTKGFQFGFRHIVIVLRKYRTDLLGLLSDLARESGETTTFRAMAWKTIFFWDPVGIEEVFVAQGGKFKKGLTLQWLRRIQGNALATSEDPLHKRQHRLIQPAFRPSHLASYAEQITCCIREHESEWKDGQRIDVLGGMRRLTLDIVAKTLFDIEIGRQSRELLGAVEIIMAQSNHRFATVLPGFPLIDKLPLPVNLRLKKATEMLDEIVYGWIRERSEGELDGTDLLTRMIIDARDQDDGSHQQVRDEIVGLLLAGHHTTASALSWVFYLISQHPLVEEELHHELDRCLEGRRADIDDVPKLKLANAIFSEALRLYPPGYALSRVATTDCEVNGVEVPQDALVYACQFVTHRDARVFANPLEFNPDRWLSGECEGLPQAAYFPFGLGARRCIGEHFAKLEVILIIANIAQKWRLRLPPDSQIEPEAGLALTPKGGLTMRLESRRSAAAKVNAKRD